MAVDVRGKYPRYVLSYQGSGPPHEAGPRDHQYGLGQLRYAKSDHVGLRDDKGRYPELHRRTGTNAGPEGHSRQRGGARPGLDTLDPLDDARGRREEFRQAGALAARRSTGRTGHGLRDVG